MARRIFGDVDYAVEEAMIGRREAKRRPELVSQYVRGKGDKASVDMLVRDIANRPFVGWDGEGYDSEDGQHHTMLFGCSEGAELAGEDLGTVELLELMLAVEREKPNVFHVIFAGNYDVNMMLRDMPLERLRELKETGQCKWGAYRLGYIKGKMFRVKKGDTSLTLYDVFTFFGCSFVKAIDQYLTGEVEQDDIRRIKEGKQLRGEFGYEQLEYVREYFRTELRYLVRLCNKLRTYLLEAGISLSKWHGPGAVASSVLRKRGFTRQSMPSHVGEASQYAYAGGRFEQFKIGRHDGPVYQYDIRSAYPAAIATLPRLDGEWREVSRETIYKYVSVIGKPIVMPYAMYYVTYVGHGALPHPFPWRHKNGAVFYPPKHGGTWVWGVELESALEHAIGKVEIWKGLVPAQGGDRPFKWIADMYDRRAQWKRDGRPAQLALKLAMNSIYGKLAQQVGWRETRDGVKLPKYHQLEHAGYVTAWTRSHLYAAMMQQPEKVIACETDAVYTTVPLELDEGERLGQWEATQYDGIVYVQSGMYFANEGGEWKYRTRGFGRGDMDVETVLQWLSGITDANAGLTDTGLCIPQTRFKTMGTSLGKSEWCTWVTSNRVLKAGVPGGKREHSYEHCNTCKRSTHSLGRQLHELVPAHSLPGVDYSIPSMKYPLEWLGDKPSEYPDDNDDVWQEDV